MRILQVSTADVAGGAESVAWRLFQEYRRLGHRSWLAVGLRQSQDPDVLAIPNGHPRRWWQHLSAGSGKLGTGAERITPLRRACVRVASLPAPRNGLDKLLGREPFDFPGTRRLLDLPPVRPEIVHAHNLHGPIVPGGGYFDLRALPWLSWQVPVVLTLHDAWLLAGHCAHSFGCERWTKGCGHCPDLTIYPPIRRDATALNWRRKKRIYAASRLHVATPSQWLMRKVEQSILAPAVVEARVIPNGVDLGIFHPGDSMAAKARLGLPTDAHVVLFAANGIRRNPWKDYATLRRALAQVGESMHEASIIFLALGEDATAERVGQVEIRFAPYESDVQAVARYYQAADLYIHAAQADTFPNTVIEALACGTPVVATAVGGIPEQVEHGVSGFLTPPADAEAMAAQITRILGDERLRQRMRFAAAAASRRYGLEAQAGAYLRWYEEILSR